MPPKRKEATEATEDASSLRRSGRASTQASTDAGLVEQAKQTAKRAKKAVEQAVGTAEPASTATGTPPADATPSTNGNGAVNVTTESTTVVEGDLPNDPPAEAVADEKEQDAAPAEKSAQKGAVAVGEIVSGDIIVQTDAGQDVTIDSLLAEKGGVFFIYPKASTPGCTKQACHFRDSYKDFEAKGYNVYGLSMDSPKSQTTFKTKQSLPYTLLCDPKQALIQPLGARKTASSVTRSHFVIEKGGRLLDAKIGVKPDASHQQALAFINSL